MNVRGYAQEIRREIDAALNGLDPGPCDRLAEAILRSKRIFLAGMGRSGLIMRSFAMRLMHLGLEVHVVGETTTPAIAGGDLLLIGSGSGETESLLAMTRRAKALGIDVALVTVHPDSSIGALADLVVRVAATTPKSSKPSAAASIQPKGSLFEQILFLICESVVLRLMEIRGIDAEGMFLRHANLE
ncbi:MAG: 6-phospho-3-hexuloisomerase [Spirochaetales bacterium]|nr:6-phospho-3-hexuloisomerase [Spirochaetales bacterium]